MLKVDSGVVSASYDDSRAALPGNAEVPAVVEVGLLMPAHWAAALIELSKVRQMSVVQFCARQLHKLCAMLGWLCKICRALLSEWHAPRDFGGRSASLLRLLPFLGVSQIPKQVVECAAAPGCCCALL